MAVKSAEDFEFMLTTSTQTRLNTEVVKELLVKLSNQGTITMEEYMGCFKDIPMVVMKTARKNPKLKATFTPPNLVNVTVVGLIDMLGDVREKAAVLKKEEGFLKTHLMAELQASGEMASEPGSNIDYSRFTDDHAMY